MYVGRRFLAILWSGAPGAGGRGVPGFPGVPPSSCAHGAKARLPLALAALDQAEQNVNERTTQGEQGAQNKT